MCEIKKKILIVTQYIYPEPFKSSEMAFELAKRGFHVEVLTGIPNYPEGKYYNGYGLFKKRKEVINNVTFYRCLQTPRKLFPGFIGQSTNYFTFVISSVFWVIFYFVWKKYDVIIAHEPSPITQIIPACILGKLRKTPVLSWIQDIWPDAVLSATGKKSKVIEKPLVAITEWIYKNSTKILITSKGMAELVNRINDYSEKIIFYPQWSEDMLSVEGIQNEVENVRLSNYTIMMVGSLNSGIGVEEIISLCEEMKNDDINFVFVGGGSEEQRMRKMVLSRGLKNVLFTGRKPMSEMPLFFKQADALLLTLKRTDMKHLDVTVPARLQGYMSAGKPILAMIGSGARNIIEEANCGFSVPSGDYKNLAQFIRERVFVDKGKFAALGNNGRTFYETHFTKNKCIDHLCEIIYNN